MRQLVGRAAQPADGNEGKIMRKAGARGMLGIEQGQQTAARDLNDRGVTRGAHGHGARLAIERGHKCQDAAGSKGRKSAEPSCQGLCDLHLSGGEDEESVDALALLAKHGVGRNISGLTRLQQGRGFQSAEAGWL